MADTAPTREGAQAQVGCADCAQGYLWSGQPTGADVALDSLPAYAAPGSGGEGGQRAILFIHDAFGWRYPNNRLLCDKLAAATGIPVYMPDLYKGETPLTEEQAQVLYDPKSTLLSTVGAGLQTIILWPRFIAHIIKFNVTWTQPALDRVVSAIKAKHGAEQCKLGAVGYCWGGKYALRLGAQGQLAATVALHPSLVNPVEDKLDATSAPTLIIRAGTDDMLPDKLSGEIEAAVKKSAAGVPLEQVVYPGTKHGFSVRCFEGDTVASKARDEALERTCAWFAKYLI